ncbi:hypothetical protein [Sphingobacterium hotanense]|uniref:Uncharacterized protein n=1 Tax=Sphingobacterium hotanense TaxID=649196 RepID=A0ABT7NLG2_9SPHI|nr:hypothetical protein [Sphingobacterium hotanense]MDM1048064.1 hypothetical protein [Sphingobacterium hotanense]
MSELVFINGLGTQASWGLILEEGNYPQLLKTPKFKEVYTYKWPDHDGEEYDSSTPRVKEVQDYNISFIVQTDTKLEMLRKYEELLEVLSASNGAIFHFPEIGRTFVLHLIEISEWQDVDFYMGKAKIVLSLRNRHEKAKRPALPPTNLIYLEQERAIDFTFNESYLNIYDYQFTLNAGETWNSLVNKPLNIGVTGYLANNIGIRVKESESNYSSSAIYYAQSIKGFVAPPTNFAYSPDSRRMNFTLASGITNLQSYELSWDNGLTWSNLVSKPFEVPNANYPANAIRLRVKESELNYASSELKYGSAIEKSENLVSFSIDLPEHINPGDVELSFPRLKFNKKFIFSYITDDSCSIYQFLFSGINKRFIATGNSSNYFHLNFPKSPYFEEGFTPEYPLQFSDGAGNMRRFATAVSVWPDKLVDESRGIGADVGMYWPWMSEKEFKLFRDFGYSVMYHDLTGYNGATVNQENFNAWFADTKSKFLEYLNDSPKTLAEPNGDHRYLHYSQEVSDLVLNTAQSGDSLIKKAYPHRSNFTLNKSMIAVERWFAGAADYSQQVFNALNAFNSTNDVDTIYWLIGSAHKSSFWEYELFKRINDHFGSIGSDRVWFATPDEVFEYWYLTNNAIVTKSVEGQKVTFNISMPKMPRFWFQEISCLLTGISQTAGLSINSNTEGLSYAVNGERLLVNLNFNKLTTLAEKYTSIFETSPNADYAYDDALYMISQLKPSLRQPYLSRINVFTSPPIFTELNINGGSSETQQDTVQLTFKYNGTVPSEFMASERSDFMDANWRAYETPVSFVLSSTFGEKNIFVKLRNTYGESEVLTAQIKRAKPSLVLNSISAPAQISENPVPITLNYSGIPTHYRLAPTNNFDGIAWLDLTNNIVPFATQAPFGQKTVYAQLQDAQESKVSAVVSTAFEFVDATSAILNSVIINDGDPDAASGDILVKLNTVNQIDEFRIGKLPDLSDASWQNWTGDLITYNTGSSLGLLTLYAQVRNSVSSSSIKNDSINILEPVTLSALVLAGGEEHYAGLNPSVNFAVTQGTPSHYRLSENELSLTTAAWIPMRENIRFEFSSLGSKTLFGQVKNSISESLIKSDTVILTEPPVSALIGWNNGVNNNNAKVVSNGMTTNQMNLATYSGYAAQQLVDTSGAILTGWFLNLQSDFYQNNAVFKGAFVGTNANFNASVASGQYSLDVMKANKTASTYGAEADGKKARVSFSLPVGSYKMNILWNTGSSNFTLTTDATRAQCFYAVFQGETELDRTICSTTAGFTGLNNQDFNAQLEFTVVNAATPVDLGWWSTSLNNRPGVNLIQIIKVN